MNTCKATVNEGPGKGLTCIRSAQDGDTYCGRHQRNKKYDEGIATGIRWCRFFFRGCDNTINELPEKVKACKSCLDKKRTRPNCHHEGCNDQAQKDESFCGKHLRDKFRIEEIEKGIKYCDIDRGCMNVCEEGRASCISCLEAKRSTTQKRLEERRIQNRALINLDTTNNRVCIKCNKEFEAFNTAKGNESHKCTSCFETQLKVELSREPRERNYKAERFTNMKTQYSMYIHNALQRGKTFPLQFDAFCNLCTKPCYYCDHYVKGEVNGVDRINNDIDYELSNCVSCCEKCNLMKSYYHPTFFIEKAKIMCGLKAATSEFFENWAIYYTKTQMTKIATYIAGAHSRNITFSLSKEDFASLIRKSCYLCGYKQRQGIGIDRFDNTIREYTLSNCRPCCASCNWAKLDHNFATFIGHCAKIAAKWPDTSTFDSIPLPSNPYKPEKVESTEPKVWKAKALYDAIMSNSADKYYYENDAYVTKEEIDTLSDNVKTVDKDGGIKILKTFLNKMNKRRARAK